MHFYTKSRLTFLIMFIMLVLITGLVVGGLVVSYPDFGFFEYLEIVMMIPMVYVMTLMFGVGVLNKPTISVLEDVVSYRTAFAKSIKIPLNIITKVVVNKDHYNKKVDITTKDGTLYSIDTYSEKVTQQELKNAIMTAKRAQKKTI